MMVHTPLRTGNFQLDPLSVSKMAPASPFPAQGNAVLAGLTPDESNRLLPLLTPCLFHWGQTLYDHSDQISNIYFPKSGIISLILTSKVGIDVEVGLIGREGMLGTSEALAEHPMLTRAVVQIAGSGWRVSAPALREVCAQSPSLSKSLWRSVQALNQQTAQCVLCNRLHSVDKRLSRWLLMCQDRMQSDTLELTHETIGKMLGTRRVGVTLASGDLRDAGLIDYSRGRITILNRPGLEARACECYSSIRGSYQALQIQI